MANNLETRRFVALTFTTVTGLTSLVISAFKDEPSQQAMFIGVTVTSMVTSVLLVSERVKNWLIKFSSMLWITVENEPEGKTAAAETINNSTTLAGSDPVIRGANLPATVRAARAKLHELISTGLNVPNCLAGLAFIDTLEPEVKNSWVLLLARGGLLVPLKLFKEAEEIALDVIAKNADCPQALGIAYSLRAWILEVNEPPKSSSQYNKWLETRTSYIETGLANYPDRHSLQMSAFEIYILHEDAEKCVLHLMAAYQIDGKFTTDKLLELKISKPGLLKQAASLSPELGKLIKEIQKNDKKTRLLELIRAGLLISSLLAVILVLSIQHASVAVQFEAWARPIDGKSAAEQTINGRFNLGRFAIRQINLLSSFLSRAAGHDVKTSDFTNDINSNENYSAKAAGHDVFAFSNNIRLSNMVSVVVRVGKKTAGPAFAEEAGKCVISWFGARSAGHDV